MSYRRHLMMKSTKIKDYLCFTALEDGTFTFAYGNSSAAGRGKNYTPYMSYSLNGRKWFTLNMTPGASITTPLVHAGECVYWIGHNGALGKYSDNMLCPFSSTGRYNISGRINSIFDYINMESDTILDSAYGYALHSVFKNNKIISAEELILPIAGRANLTGYEQTYSYMFAGCTDMIYPPKNVRLANGGRLVDGMFQGCTSLIKSPVFDRNVLGQYQYNLLFDGCTSLKHIMMLATDISARKALDVWVRNVPATSDGIFVKHINAAWTTRGNSGVPNNWQIIYYDPALDKYYLDQNRTTECDDHGNVIN